MMRSERCAHPGQAVAQPDGLLNGDALAPSDQMPAHLVDAAGLEAHRERAVAVLFDGLVRVEEEGRGVRRCLGIETQGHLNGFFLERAERPSGVVLQVEFRVPLEPLAVIRASPMLARRQRRGSSLQSVRPTRKARVP